MEFAVIYSDLYNRKIKTYSDKYQYETTNLNKHRAIIYMRTSKNDDPTLLGWVPALFKGKNTDI